MVNQFGEEDDGGGSAGDLIVYYALSGTTSVAINESTFGSYHIQASGLTAGDPTISCDVSKRTGSDVMVIKNVVGNPSTDTCALGIEWPAGGYIQLSKSESSHNGMYAIIVIGTA